MKTKIRWKLSVAVICEMTMARKKWFELNSIRLTIYSQFKKISIWLILPSKYGLVCLSSHQWIGLSILPSMDWVVSPCPACWVRWACGPKNCPERLCPCRHHHLDLTSTSVKPTTQNTTTFNRLISRGLTSRDLNTTTSNRLISRGLTSRDLNPISSYHVVLDQQSDITWYRINGLISRDIS